MDWKIYAGTLVRQLLTGVGTVLVANGIIPQAAVGGLLDSLTSLIVGGAVVVVGYLWSLISKQKALNTPV